MTTLTELKAGPRSEALFDLLTRLTPFNGINFKESRSKASTFDVRTTCGLPEAQVISSRYSNQTRHALVLDIDHPAWLVKSTTPNHFHLYIDVPGGIPHGRYMALLTALSAAGVIETGYSEASRDRGQTFVRLPWIKKGQD